MIARNYDLVRCTTADVEALTRKWHAYGGAGGVSTYAFAVVERGSIVAAYSWQPPAYGAALSVCPSAPYGVLMLSRMVACPRPERQLRHVSKPLRAQMRQEIDRSRWPALITYSDEGLGHTGHVYKCSGFKPTHRAKRTHYVKGGRRVSTYQNGRGVDRSDCERISTVLQRWEHWACQPTDAASHIARQWERVATGRRWRSGAPAMTTRRRELSQLGLI